MEQTDPIKSKGNSTLPTKDVQQKHVRVGVGVLVKDPLRQSAIFAGLRKGSHGAGTLALPGGHLEMFESWNATAIREVKEETDLDLDPESCSFAHVTNDPMKDERKHYVTVFVTATCKENSSIPKNMEPHKCAGWKSYTWEELKTIQAKREPELFGPLRRLLEDEPEFVQNFLRMKVPLHDTPTSDKIQSCLGLINRLRHESFNIITEAKLATHPYVLAAEEGVLTTEQKRAFAREQFAIQKSDAISFAYLAGHRGFVPTSLSFVKVPPAKPQVKFPKQDGVEDLFQFLLDGEILAAPLLLDYAEFLGMGKEEGTRGESARKLSSLAQAYASYWARLALSNHRAAAAAASAVNFPAWAKMCKRLADATYKLDKDKRSEEELDNGLAFLLFFAKPIDNLDHMAAAVMAQEEHLCYNEMAKHVQLLQEYEVLFWDACCLD